MTLDSPDRTEDCTSCQLDDRRRFLLRAAAFLAAGSSLVPSALQALHATTGRTVTGVRDGEGAVRYPVPASDGVSIDAENEVILVRTGGAVIAFALACPHQRAMLRQKRGDTAFQCPKHKSEYKADGVFIRGRATRNMDRRAVRRENGEIVVDVDSLIRSDQDAAGWQAATVGV